MTSRKVLRNSFAVLATVLLAGPVVAQVYDITTFDPMSEGPWSDVAGTTLTVPMVPDGGITLDGRPTSGEYGGFAGVTVTPGVNAWILNWPPDQSWDGADDSSFTFYLAHDSQFLYVGVDVKDDIVTTDDPNAAFWRDDSIELVVDALNDRYDVNTDQIVSLYGGHSYANYEGRFSAWNDDTEQIDGTRWTSDVDWTYGSPDEDHDISGFGEPSESGWNMEMRFKKSLFEDPVFGNKLEEGYVMGFNIGLDDDDQRGTGPMGNAERTQDLELQYFWANRARPVGWNEDESFFYTEEEIRDRVYEQDYNLVIEPNGRLTHGATGEIILGGLSLVGDCNGDGTVDQADVDCACAAGQDLSPILTAIGSLPGDADFDGEVQFSDFVILSENFGQQGGYSHGRLRLRWRRSVLGFRDSVGKLRTVCRRYRGRGSRASNRIVTAARFDRLGPLPQAGADVAGHWEQSVQARALASRIRCSSFVK